MDKRLKEILDRLNAIEARSSEIVEAVETAEGEDLRALSTETDALTEERETLEKERKEIEDRKAMAEKINAGNAHGEEVKTPKEGIKKMTLEELRNSVKYVNAYANYVKSGDMAEVREVLDNADVSEEERALLTTNATKGTVPVPTVVETAIRTAWDNEPIMARVRKISVKGNYEVGFEYSATDAVVHEEGTDAPAEEELKLGIVKLVPGTLKKWITVSDEVLDLNGEAFLEYIYAEIAHKIAKKAADTLIDKINKAPETATETAPSVPTVASTGLTDFINAVAKLSDEATNPVIIMNKQSYAYYKGLAIAANYSVDPFDGLDVLFNNTLTPADGTTAGTYAIVGDLGNGAEANFPNGEGVSFKLDDVSLAEKDLVKVVGRCPSAIEVVADKQFVKVVKA